jgi:hypothetical protein
MSPPKNYDSNSRPTGDLGESLCSAVPRRPARVCIRSTPSQLSPSPSLVRPQNVSVFDSCINSSPPVPTNRSPRSRSCVNLASTAHLQLDRVPIGSGRERPVLPQFSGSIRRLGSTNFGGSGRAGVLLRLIVVFYTRPSNAVEGETTIGEVGQPLVARCLRVEPDCHPCALSCRTLTFTGPRLECFDFRNRAARGSG